ncbi:MAG: hypothetical protein AAFR76_00065 [Planctomycetota bacterium]
MWSLDELADTAAAGIADANLALRDEDAVRGLDHLDEVDIHTVLEAAFLHADLDVLREHPFPTPPKRRPKASERERCDLVLLPEPDLTLADPETELAEREDAEATLFAPAADQLVTPADLDPADAFWLEIKATGQFVARDDVPQSNRRYTTELIRAPAADIRKLAREPLAEQAAVAIVLFAADEPTARHDLGVAVHRWLDDDLPVRSPAIRVTPIDERIGNTVAAVCLVPIRPTL